MSISQFHTLEAYLEAVEPSSLGEILRALIHTSLDIPQQILTFMLGEHDYSGIINVSGDEQLSLDIATHELFIQKMPENLYSLLLGEETDETNIKEGTGEYIILGDFIDGSSIVRSRGPGAIVHVINNAGKTLAAFTVCFNVFMRFDLATDIGYLQFIYDGNDFRVIKDNLNLTPSKKPVYGFGGKYDDYSDKQKKYFVEIDKRAKLRYGGCMVQDMNNVFDKTGVFGYFAPKLRFCYEIIPYLYILSKVGGDGFYITPDGHEIRYQDIKPLDVPKLDDMNYLHQRVGYVGGSKDLIDLWFSLD